MSVFKQALALCGLSTYQQASDYLTKAIGRPVSADTIKNLAHERAKVNPDLWEALRDLWDQINVSADQALDLIEESEAAEVELQVDGARSSDWPTLDAHLNALAIVALTTDKPVV